MDYAFAAKFRLSVLGLLLAVPWLISALPGPSVAMTAWFVCGLVLALLPFTNSLHFWPQSLIAAAGLNLCLGFLQYVGWSGELSRWIAQASLGEMLGNLRQRNQLATLFAIGLLGLLALRDLKQGVLLWLVLLAASLGLGNALSGSRTGLLQWLALLALALCWRRCWGAKMKWVLGAALLGYGVGALLGPWAAQIAGHGNSGVLSRLGDAGGSGRLVLWSNVLELIWREPLLGHGWRSLAYAHYAADFSGARFMEMPDNAHNLPLHLAVELGLPVAIGFCALVGWAVWRGKPWHETRADRQLAWGVLLMIGIHSMLEYPLWYGPFFMTALICVGVLCGDLWRNLLLASTDSARSAIILGVRCVAVLLLAVTAFVAFDYHRVSQIYLQPEERSSWYVADPLGSAQRSVLFQPQAKFAELQITPLSKESAPRVLELSSELVRWSPEPRIIEKLIESAVMMGQDDLAAFHLKRYRAAYPAAYARFVRSSR